MTRGADDFLARWSSRKLKAQPEPEPAPPPVPAEPAGAAPDQAAPSVTGKPDDEILRELGLPDPDRLVKGDDFSAFLKTGVPARLRRRALRRLWVSDPVLANLDGLNDYEEDFTDAATVVKDLKTAYKVGRGFLRTEEETAAAAAETGNAGEEAAAAPEDGAEPAGTETIAAGDDAPVEQAEGAPAAGPAGTAGSTDDGAGPADPASDDATPRPRRMRFHFSAG